jgi:hypothetical protein
MLAATAGYRPEWVQFIIPLEVSARIIAEHVLLLELEGELVKSGIWACCCS